MLGETTQEYRERLVRHEAERLENRERELSEVTSPNNSAAVRISKWERVYHLAMPREAGHRMLTTIARQTGLTQAEVETEQQARAARRLKA